MVDEPNQGATGGAEAEAPEATASGTDPGPAGAGAPINQGAAGGAPSQGESPLRVETEGDVFSDRPEIFVGAAFAGGFALAQILKRFGS